MVCDSANLGGAIHDSWTTHLLQLPEGLHFETLGSLWQHLPESGNWLQLTATFAIFDWCSRLMMSEYLTERDSSSYYDLTSPKMLDLALSQLIDVALTVNSRPLIAPLSKGANLAKIGPAESCYALLKFAPGLSSIKLSFVRFFPIYPLSPEVHRVAPSFLDPSHQCSLALSLFLAFAWLGIDARFCDFLTSGTPLKAEIYASRLMRPWSRSQH